MTTDRKAAAARRAGLIAGLLGDTTKPAKPSRAYAAGRRAGAALRDPTPPATPPEPPPGGDQPTNGS